jgi:hypothetical protein
MAIISRITTWAVNQILTSSALNGEFNNVVNTLNNLDAGTTSWDNVVLVAPSTTALSAATYSQIKLLQTVTATTATSVSSSSSTFTAFTGLTVSITPTSASSRIRVSCQTVIQTFSGGVSYTLKRGATELSGVVNGFGLTGIGDGASGANMPISLIYIDSPATTSTTAYQLFFRSNNNSTNVAIGRTDVLSVIIAEEIV